MLPKRYEPLRRKRRSIRLAAYDYSTPGLYFVTICTAQRGCLFGEVKGEAMVLSDCGEIAEEEWQRSARVRQELELDSFVVMPNHVHGIVSITVVADVVGARGARPSQKSLLLARRSLGAFVAGFKSSVTHRVKALRGTEGSIWQRNYYEHIIRNERGLDRIRAYIEDNPRRWAKDEYNPKVPV